MTEFKVYLQDEFLRRTKNNPCYSLRAFADSLDIHPGTLSQLMSGKRQLSSKGIQKLGEALKLKPQLIKSFLDSERSKKNKADIPYEDLAYEVYQVISEWYYFAIIELQHLPGFQWDEGWIAKKLGLPVSTTKAAIERLGRLNLINRDSGISKSPRFTKVASTNEGQYARQSFLHSVFTQAAQALDIPKEQRFHTALISAGSKAQSNRLREMVRDFRDKIDEELGQAEAFDEVYQVCFAFYPLTKETKIRSK